MLKALSLNRTRRTDCSRAPLALACLASHRVLRPERLRVNARPRARAVTHPGIVARGLSLLGWGVGATTVATTLTTLLARPRGHDRERYGRCGEQLMSHEQQ